MTGTTGSPPPPIRRSLRICDRDYGRFTVYPSRPLADARHDPCSEPAGRRSHPPPPRRVHLRLDRDVGEIARTVRSAALCECAILCRGWGLLGQRRPRREADWTTIPAPVSYTHLTLPTIYS